MKKQIFVLCKNINPVKFILQTIVWLEEHGVPVNHVFFEDGWTNKIETPHLEIYSHTNTIDFPKMKFDEVFGVPEYMVKTMKKDPYSKSFEGSLRDYLIYTEVFNEYRKS